MPTKEPRTGRDRPTPGGARPHEGKEHARYADHQGPLSATELKPCEELTVAVLALWGIALGKGIRRFSRWLGDTSVRPAPIVLAAMAPFAKEPGPIDPTGERITVTTNVNLLSYQKRCIASSATLFQSPALAGVT